MTDYTRLVAALRCKRDDCEGCGLAFFDKDEGWMCQYAAKDDDAADAIEALQAENTDIREELFISQREYDEFTMIASMQNAMLAKQLPKRGEWIEDATTYAGPGLSNYKCSLCGKICGTWRRGLKPSELPNWCGNCGADMRAKMEVQDG